MTAFEKIDQIRSASHPAPTMFERVRKLLVEQLGVDELDVTLEANIVDDLGADSLDRMELVMSLEDVFPNVSIPDDEAERIKTVGDVVALVDRKLVEQGE